MKDIPQIPPERLWIVYGALIDSISLLDQIQQFSLAKGLRSWLNLVDIIWEDELDVLKAADEKYVDTINALLPKQPGKK